MNQNCSTEVITASGKFTFHGQYMSRCEAKKLCAESGGILAPVTNKEDAEAIYETMRAGQHEGFTKVLTSTSSVSKSLLAAKASKKEFFQTEWFGTKLFTRAFIQNRQLAPAVCLRAVQ